MNTSFSPNSKNLGMSAFIVFVIAISMLIVLYTMKPITITDFAIETLVVSGALFYLIASKIHL